MFAVKEPPAPGPSSFLFRSKDFNRDVDMLTPSLPLSRSLDLPVCLARFPSARLWLRDESLEDSANLPDPDIITAEIVEDLQAALAQSAEIASDLRWRCVKPDESAG